MLRASDTFSTHDVPDYQRLTCFRVGTGSDREEQAAQQQANGFSQDMMATAAQPITPGFSDAVMAADEGVQLYHVCVTLV